MAGSAGVARAEAESGIRFARDYLETDRTQRERTANESALAQREIAGGGENWMSRSRKNWNTVNAASLARWIVLTAFVALMGLSYVYLTLQLYHLGDRKKALETEVANLRMQNEVASAQIAALTSRSALQRRLKEGYLKMIPIAEHNIVRLTMPARNQEDTVQPVSNQRGAR